ncbi:MAG: CerR family C-terminal domain-containing protein [Acidiferrobacterales bacterium]
MSLSNDEEMDTRQRLIEAATITFIEQGFDAAKVRDIVARAGANIAAVNYHFGSKEGLYAAVIRYNATQAMEDLPHRADGGEAGTPEGRLRDYIRNFLQRLLVDTPQFTMSKLVAREIIEPTAAFDLIIEKFVRPQYLDLTAIVRAIGGNDLSDESVRRCALSVVGQCLYYQCARRVVARIDPGFEYGPDDIGRLADHVTAFSLGGLRQLKRSPSCGDFRPGS